MRFWKMNGAGNDFIVIDNVAERIPTDELPNVARVLCTRRMSIGADGLMAVDRAEGDADFKLRFYNCDGSVGEMCGNGARCICRYGYENGLAGEVQRIETTAGVVEGRRVSERVYRIRLNDPSEIELDRRVDVCGRTVECSYVVLGDPGIPHAVVPMRGLRDLPDGELFELGKAIRWHESFPKGANVNFCEVTGRDEFLIKTFERGVEGFTYACGTGTASTAAALCLRGLIGESSRAVMAGGELSVDVGRGGAVGVSSLHLTGPTNVVARGDVTDEELRLRS